MTIRPACPDDAPALLAIYGKYIDTPITFEYKSPSIEEFERRIRDISAFYPYLVCESDGRPIGYAYAHRQMERAAYQWNAELSIYLDPSATSRGVGSEMYSALIELLGMQGVQTAYSLITLPNARSEGIHAKMGFRLVGILHKTGFKNGEWHDVGWFELELMEHNTIPVPPVSLSSLPPENIAHVLAAHSARLN